MASIPLPALSIRPPEQQDQMGQIARALQIKNMMQQAPLQTEAMQQENQQRSQSLKDQQAMTKAMQNWDGKDYNQLAPLVIKEGGSAQAVMGLKQKQLEMQQKYSDIAKADAETGSKNVETKMKQNDMVSGALSNVVSAPDEQLPQMLTSTAQQLVQQGLIDPQHAQMAQQLAQSGAPAAQLRAQIDTFRKSFMADSQLLEEAQKKASTNASNVNAQKTQIEADQIKKYGGVGVDAQQQADWLNKNPGKGASDYKMWVMKNSPTAMVLNNQLAGDKNQQALDFAADNYRRTGQLPSGFARSPQTTAAIISRAAELDKQAGGQGIAVNKTDLEANKKSLDNLQKNFDQVSAFESTARKNLDLMLSKAEKVPELGTRFANVPIRMINEKMIGTKEMAEFRAALTTAQTETAKVLNSSNASGVLSDTARKELEDIMSGNLPFAALKGQVQTFHQDMDNRHQSYQMQIDDIKNRIRNSGSGSTPPPQSNSNDPFAQFGGKAH